MDLDKFFKENPRIFDEYWLTNSPELLVDRIANEAKISGEDYTQLQKDVSDWINQNKEENERTFSKDYMISLYASEYDLIDDLMRNFEKVTYFPKEDKFVLTRKI